MKKITGIRNLLIINLLMILAFSSCRTTRPAVDNKDLSYLYNPLKNSVNPRYSIVNQSDNISELAVKFFNTDLFFTEANPRGIPTAMVFISVRLFNISNGRFLADTAFYNIDIIKEQSKDEYLYKIPLSVEKGNNYVAEVKIADRIRQQMIQTFIPFNTLSDFNRYNFFARGHFMHNELLNHTVRKNEFLNLIYTKNRIDTLFISFYKPYEVIPDAPSMLFPERTIEDKPDTTIAIVYSDTLPMMFPKKGIYFCSARRENNEGYSLFNFGTNFPAMTTPDDMIEPLAYLASQNEMEELRSSVRQKAALDDFWIKCGGNIDKARELIRIFYTRVLYSNYYFTSFREGWRTDRGMIYTIYGPPDKLYKSNEEESWGYRRPVVRSRWGTNYSVKEEFLFFNFKKKDNKFSDNEFSLSRTDTDVTFWGKAVQSWRKGIVFRLDNPEDI